MSKEELLKKIEALEARIRQLEAQPPVQYHYHQYPQPYFVPQAPQPYYIPPPTIWCGSSLQGPTNAYGH